MNLEVTRLNLPDAEECRNPQQSQRHLESTARKVAGRPKGTRNKNARDLSGKRFGSWVVISDGGLSRHKKVRWNCKCDCGHVQQNDASALVTGRTKSCGCVKTGISKSQRRDKVNHGLSYTPECAAWSGMQVRCYSKKCRSYKHYGGKGIKVCDWLKESPVNLVSLIGEKPKQTRAREFSVDRIDNNGNYSCGKCDNCKSMNWKMNIRWATQNIQHRNNSRNRIIVIDGVSMCISDWAKHTGVKLTTISSRVRRGFSGADLIS